MPKWEFTGETAEYEIRKGSDADGGIIKKVKRIRALRDIENADHFINAGTTGGWIEFENNLSQEGEGWIDEGSVVTDGAVVSGDAFVGEGSYIGGKCSVSGNAVVVGTVVRGDCRLGTGVVAINSEISGYIQLADIVLNEIKVEDPSIYYGEPQYISLGNGLKLESLSIDNSTYLEKTEKAPSQG